MTWLNLRHGQAGDTLVRVAHRGQDNHHLPDGVEDGDVENCLEFPWKLQCGQEIFSRSVATNERVSEDGPQYGCEVGHHCEPVEQDGGVRVTEPDHSGHEQD